MQDSIPAKRKNRVIYFIIILSFLLLAWIVWLFFDARIKGLGLKKKEQISRRTTFTHNTINTTVPLTINQQLS